MFSSENFASGLKVGFLRLRARNSTGTESRRFLDKGATGSMPGSAADVGLGEDDEVASLAGTAASRTSRGGLRQ